MVELGPNLSPSFYPWCRCVIPYLAIDQSSTKAKRNVHQESSRIDHKFVMAIRKDESGLVDLPEVFNITLTTVSGMLDVSVTGIILVCPLLENPCHANI